ncbi:MAG: glutathione S-transferase N-terminal domain-containing protein [Burkholderiaceae bacterium]
MSSINVRKVVLAAQWMGLDFQRTDAGLSYGINKTPEYLRMNPNGQIPVMQDGEFTLWESNVIVRYLCAKHSIGALYPTDLRQRFDAERWMDWQQTTMNNVGRAAFVEWIRTPGDKPDMAVIAKSIAATEPQLAMLDSHLAQRPFMAGDAMTMADFPIACEMHRWWGLPPQHPALPRSAYPHLSRWYGGICAQPASQGVLDIVLS